MRGVLISYFPPVLLDISLIGYQNQVLWKPDFPVQVPWAVETNAGLRHLPFSTSVISPFLVGCCRSVGPDRLIICPSCPPKYGFFFIIFIVYDLFY